MKKIILLILLFLVGVSYGQSTKDVVNSSLATTILDSAGIWQPNAWRNVTGYNSATFVIKSDKSSASNGVKIYWGELINNVYRIVDSVTTSYITNVPFSLTLSVVAPYLKVKYTNTTSAQTSFLFTTMLHVGQQLKLTDDGGLIISGATSNGALETTQLLILSRLGTNYLRSVDTWGTAVDTSTYNFNNAYLKAYITVYDTSATADTLVFEHYSYGKNAYTTNAIGFRDVLTDYLEADNTTVIIPASTAKTFEVNMFRPGILRVRPKTVTGRTTVKTKRVVWVGVN